MKLERKLFRLIQNKYDESESISRTALIGLSSAVNRNMINSLASDSSLCIKVKDGRIVPIILVVDDSRGVQLGVDRMWQVFGLSEKFEEYGEALEAYYKNCQEGYQDRGWGCGGQRFAVSVRNVPDTPVVYLATAKGDLNASIDTSIVTFGFLPTTNEGDGCGYFLGDEFYLSLLPRVACETSFAWPKDYAKTLRPVFDEMSNADMAWQLMSALNERTIDADKLPCCRLEAILGLPNSEQERLTSSMLKRQFSLMKMMSEILSTPEKSLLFDRLKAELVGHEDIVDLFSEYILRESAVAAIEDNIFSIYAGRARNVGSFEFETEPWWNYFTVQILERVLTMADNVSSTFKVKAMDQLVGAFHDKRQPLVGRNSMRFSFEMDCSSASVSVLRGKNILEADIPIDEGYEYLADKCESKVFKLTFGARVDAITKPTRATHDVILLDMLDAGCFMTIGDNLLLKKASPFQPSRKNAKHSFVAHLQVNKETNGSLQLFTGSHFALDETSVTITYDGESDSTALSVNSYDNYLGIRCDLKDGAELSFVGKVNGKRTSYTVAIQIEQKDEGSYQSVYKHLVECHLSGAGNNASVSFDSGTISSRLSQEHIAAVGDTKGIVGYPLLVADDVRLVRNNPWLDSFVKATSKVCVPMDPRPDADVWRIACERPAAREYFSARYELFKELRNAAELGGDVVEEYSLDRLSKPENQQLRVLLTKYLSAYNTWLESDYENASVVDTVWAYFTKGNSLGERPDAIMLLPQHPLRLYWQFQAQRYMREMLEIGMRSNVVASFDSHSIPDVLHIPIRNSTTGKSVTVSFFALPTSSDYWGVYHSYEPSISAEILDQSPFFENWGFEVTSVKRTMSAGEVESAVNATQAVCIAKDTLNVRYVAKNLGSNSARLLLRQGVAFLTGKDDGGPKFGPRMVSIVGPQTSKNPEGVTEAEIMRAREQTMGRLQWYADSSHEQSRLKVDVTIASLGGSNIAAYHMEERPSFGVTCAGGLLRYRNRSRGVAAACEIVESRLTRAVPDATSDNEDNVFLYALDLVEGEKNFLRESCPGHVRFNADIVGAGIMKPNDDSSHYYAISSSDVDQACFESLNGNAGIYLWEYRLPMPGAHSGGTDGFYLLAKENDTMIQAVSEAVKSLDANGASDDVIRKMLFMSARRGIPTVKNLASGGKSALGEVGVLVTLNTLQGGLQEDPTIGLLPARLSKDGFEYYNILVPMDVFRERFELLVREIVHGAACPTRPDIVAFSIKCKCDGDDLTPIRMRLSFIEVKTRRDKMSESAMEDALHQADYIFQLYTIDDAAIPRLYRWERLDFLVGMLTFGFRVYESMPSLLAPLVSLYPKVVAAMFEQVGFLEVNQLPRLSVIHAAECSSPLLEQDGVFRAIQIAKKDGYRIAIGKDAPLSIQGVGTWGLLAEGEVGNASVNTLSDVKLQENADAETMLQSAVCEKGLNNPAYNVVNSSSGSALTPSPQPYTTAQIVKHRDESGIGLEEKYADLLSSIKEAFEDFKIQTKRLAPPIETPNLILIDYKGTKSCTEARVAHYQKEFLSTYGIDLFRVESRSGAIRFVLRREQREILFMDEIWQKYGYDHTAAAQKGLLVAIREDDGQPIYLNPQREAASPHTLVAGTTGSGKSVLLLNMLYCLRDRFTQDEVKVYIMDPKMVDFVEFEGVPNFSVISTKESAENEFVALVEEMNHRYELMKARKVKKISQYNSLSDVKRLPLIWCFHDEFADWFGDDTYKDKVVSSIASLSAKARAAGIFLVFATQRPEANIMPPVIRANLGLRLVLKVSDLGTSALSLGAAKSFGQANELLGKGHMIAVLSDLQAYCQVPNIKGLD